MGAASDYWNFVRLDSAGDRKVEERPFVKAFFLDQFPDALSQNPLPHPTIQRRLVALQNGLDQQTADLACQALRCFISRQIEQVCHQIAAQFGRDRGFGCADLLPFVLDDFDRLPASKQTAYRSLATEILEGFDPNRASLSTWTHTLVHSHPELNAFLLMHGVYRVSNWAILNDTSPRQLQRIWQEFHHFAPDAIEKALGLLESYHAIYRRDRLQQRQAGLSWKCLPPSLDQLQQIGQLFAQQLFPQHGGRTLSPDDIMDQLNTTAEYLRQYRIHVRGGVNPQVSMDDPSISVHPDSLKVIDPDNPLNEPDEPAEFLSFYRDQFLSCLDSAIQKTTQHYYQTYQRKSPAKATHYLSALHLFHCEGLSMGDIAPRVGLKAQFEVSRLLQLKPLRTDIRITMLQTLRDRTLPQAKRYADPRQLRDLDGRVELALDEQITTMIAQAEAEAQIPKNRTANSLFAQRLCLHLNRLQGES